MCILFFQNSYLCFLWVNIIFILAENDASPPADRVENFAKIFSGFWPDEITINFRTVSAFSHSSKSEMASSFIFFYFLKLKTRTTHI